MEFKSATNVFEKKDRFADEMRRFVCDEAARFTTSGNEAASASIDEFAEKGVRFSIEKNKQNIREQKQILVEIKQKEKEQKKNKDTSINQSETELPDGISSSGSSEPSSDSKSSSDSKEKSDSGHEASKKEKEHDNKKENAKKEKSKEEKKAGAKTAVASMLRAKRELSNDLVGNKVTGDALADGNTGIMKMFTELINPMTYVRKFLAYLAGIIAPYILAFMAIATVVLIIVMFIFSVLEPLKEIGDAISGFISMFTTSDEVVNDDQSDDEIDAIIDSMIDFKKKQ